MRMIRSIPLIMVIFTSLGLDVMYAILGMAIYLFYFAYGLWRYRDIKKYGNQYLKSEDVKDVDGYIKWWIKWYTICGSMGIVFFIIEFISNALGYGSQEISVIILATIAFTIIYAYLRQSKFK